MSDCKCITSEITFYVCKKRTHWYDKIPFSPTGYPVACKTLVIHGDSLGEIDKQVQNVKTELLKKWGDKYVIHA